MPKRRWTQFFYILISPKTTQGSLSRFLCSPTGSGVKGADRLLAPHLRHIPLEDLHRCCSIDPCMAGRIIPQQNYLSLYTMPNQKQTDPGAQAATAPGGPQPEKTSNGQERHTEPSSELTFSSHPSKNTLHSGVIT